MCEYLCVDRVGVHTRREQQCSLLWSQWAQTPEWFLPSTNSIRLERWATPVSAGCFLQPLGRNEESKAILTSRSALCER